MRPPARPVAEFEPVGRPLRVPPKDLSRRGPRLEVIKPGPLVMMGPAADGDAPITAAELKEAQQVSDSALFLDPEAAD